MDNAVLNTSNGVLQYNADDTMQNTLKAPDGEMYRIVLSDGTQVWLNAATNLRFPFRFYGTQCDVYLDSETYFKVAKEAADPFIVHTPFTQVLVFGHIIQ